MVMDNQGGMKIPKSLPLDWLTRQDELALLQIDLLKALLQKMGVPAFNGQGTVIQLSQGGIDLGVGGYDLLPPQQIFNKEGLREASKAYFPQNMADISQADNVLIILNSSFDQDVTVQAVGAITKQADAVNTFNIESSQTLSAGALIGIGVDLGSLWYPYMGVSVTTGSTAPASGYLDAWVYVRRKR